MMYISRSSRHVGSAAKGHSTLICMGAIALIGGLGCTNAQIEGGSGGGGNKGGAGGNGNSSGSNGGSGGGLSISIPTIPDSGPDRPGGGQCGDVARRALARRARARRARARFSHHRLRQGRRRNVSLVARPAHHRPLGISRSCRRSAHRAIPRAPRTRSAGAGSDIEPRSPPALSGNDVQLGRNVAGGRPKPGV